MNAIRVEWVAYQCGVVVPLVEARALDDGAHIFEHPEGDVVFRARTHLFEPVPSRKQVDA